MPLRSSVVRLASLLAVLVVALGPFALRGAAAGALTMNARIMLQGHARAGSWAAIEVDLQNDGPPIDGELRMEGGAQSTVRYAMAVNLPTGSHQAYVLHAQPPAAARPAAHAARRAWVCQKGAGPWLGSRKFI